MLSSVTSELTFGTSMNIVIVISKGKTYVPFCWFISQGSIIGMLTGLKHAEDTFQALTCSCGVPSIIPAGELEDNNTFTYASSIYIYAFMRCFYSKGVSIAFTVYIL